MKCVSITSNVAICISFAPCQSHNVSHQNSKKKNFKFKTNFSSYSSLMLSVSSFPPSVNFTVNAHMEASTMHTLISFVLVTYNIGKPTTRRHTKYSEIFIKISTFEWKWQLSKQRPPFCLRVILLYQGLKFLHYIHSSTYQKFAFKH